MNGIISLKKPLNTLQGPVYPKIQKDPLRFVNAKKYWKSNVGDMMLETEKYPIFLENIVEFQSRNRNETMYGKSSHRDEIKRFIPPMVSPYDLIPLTKQPRRITVPRINPEMPGQVFQDRNLNNIYGYFTDRIKPGTLTTKPLFLHPIGSIGDLQPKRFK